MRCQIQELNDTNQVPICEADLDDSVEFNDYNIFCKKSDTSSDQIDTKELCYLSFSFRYRRIIPSDPKKMKSFNPWVLIIGACGGIVVLMIIIIIAAICDKSDENQRELFDFPTNRTVNSSNNSNPLVISW